MEKSYLYQAQKYLEALGNGSDPVTGEKLSADTVLNRAEFARVFLNVSSFISEYLDRPAPADSSLRPFDPKEKVIEYLMEDPEEMKKKERLIRMDLRSFAKETASESPAPGGGSVSALMGALGAALATMVANLSAHKRGWDDRWKEFSDVAERGQALVNELLALVDEDTAAFDRIMDALSMPKGTPEEKQARAAALEDATLYAAKVPLRTMEASLKALPLALEMASRGNPASASDAGVAALAALAAVRGAPLNVRINAAGLQDPSPAARLLARAREIEARALALQDEVLAAVDAAIK